MTKYIAVGTRGHYMTVDDEDYNLLKMYTWRLSTKGYAQTHIKGVKLITIYAHRLINHTPTGYDTAHLNHRKLDNRRANLKTITKTPK